MSILIPGMEMPTSCFQCEFRTKIDPDNLMCIISQKTFEDRFYHIEHRDESCPLVPVPEHGDLIDKSGVDVLSWTEDPEKGFDDGVLFVLDKLDELPVIIPADKEGE